jgi:DNA-binding phage protein
MTSFSFGPENRKDRIAARFMAQVHAVLAWAAMDARAKRGVTQASVARDLGVDRATISRLLAGGGNPTIRTIGELAGAMGYRPELVLHKIQPAAGANPAPLIVQGTTVRGAVQNTVGTSGTVFSANVKKPALEDAR